MMPNFIRAQTLTVDLVQQERLVLYEIQKCEVVNNNYRRIEEVLDVLNKCGTQGREKIMISFAYDDDPRELLEIPAVVTYVKHIFVLCPHLAYFLAPGVDTLRIFLLCLSGARVVDKSSVIAKIGVDRNVFMRVAAKAADEASEYGKGIGDAERTEDLLRRHGL